MVSREISQVMHAGARLRSAGDYIQEACKRARSERDSASCSTLSAEPVPDLKIGRDGEIRTRDPLHPMQVRYQAAPRPD
jgi:hypothetical protein